MNPNTVRQNINICVEQWHCVDSEMKVQPIVCIICDRFIVSDTKQYLSLQQLAYHQHKFHDTEDFNLDAELLSSYRIPLPDLPLSEVLSENFDIQNCLLSPRSLFVNSESGPIGFNLCSECNRYIIKDQRPPFCIANNFCFGMPPQCLLDLTDIERVFLTPVRTHGYQYCYTGGKKQKLVGSLIHYKLDTASIIQSIAQLTLARVNIVIVLYGTLTKQQYNKAKNKNHLRINMLQQAIEWLLINNKEWRSMNISRTQYREFIDGLNNDSIPNLTYNISVTDDDDIEVESNEVLHVYYPDGNININTGGQQSIETLQELVREAHLNHDDIACKFNVFSQAVSDYKDNNLVNTCLLQFPYGRGGISENRKTLQNNDTTNIDIEKYMQYMSMLSLPQFHDGLFTLIMFNMVVRLKMVRTANWQIRHKVDATMLATEISWEDIESAINATKIARGTLTEQQERGSQLLKAVDAVCQTAPHNNDAARQAKRKAEALQHYFGCPTFFLTVTPDDDNHFCIQVMSGEFIDDNVTPISETQDTTLIERSKLRTLLRLKYPGICALFFDLALKTVMTNILGWDIENNRQDSLGLFGKIDAFSCSIEEQGRSTLHAHFLIWVQHVNKLRDELHNFETQWQADRLITHIINKITSCKSCFNDDNLLPTTRSGSFQRPKFYHDCTNKQYGLPEFPTDDDLIQLRLDKMEGLKVIVCKYCGHKWSFIDLHESYIKDYLKVPYFISFEHENKVRRLKAIAIQYQRNNDQADISHYAIDYGYNLHKHTSSCFKLQKNDKKRIFQNNECSCRYRYPQKKRQKTILQNVTAQLLPWYNWFGTYEMRNIKEICIKRKPYDAFQNTYLPAISYSKLTCNTNIQFMNPGPFGGYCFHYCMKSTQKDDIEPYLKLKKVIGTIISGIKYHDNDRMEAIRRLLSASFTHQADTTIRPTLAAYLIRNKSRFIFSHDFVWCPLQNLSSLTMGQSVTANVSIINMQPTFICAALHYLCRPATLELLCPFDFYSLYEIVNFSKDNEQQGAKRLINTQHFTHPSYTAKTNTCSKACMPRKKAFIVQVQQQLFCDASDFHANILLEDTTITEDIEKYSHLILLLFLPYRCNADLIFNDTFTHRLRHATQTNSLHQRHQSFLQYIQDCKCNNFRFDIKNNDLERPPEPFTTNNIDSNDNQVHDQVPFGGLQADLVQTLTANMINFLTTDVLNVFDDNNNAPIALSSFNTDIIRQKGVFKSGYSCLPTIACTDQIDPLYTVFTNFVLNTTNNNIPNAIDSTTVEPISVKKTFRTIHWIQ